MSENEPSGVDSPWLRAAVWLGILGNLGVIPLLWHGFTQVGMTIGMFVGFPCLGLAILIYLVVVLRDLRGTGLL